MDIIKEDNDASAVASDSVYNDIHDVLRSIHAISQEEELFKEKINNLKNCMDAYEAIFQATSKSDIDEIVDDYITKERGTEDEQQLVQNLQQQETLRIYKLLGVNVQCADNEKVLMKFDSIVEFPTPMNCIFALRLVDNIFELAEFCLPSCVPVEELSEVHLQEDNYDFQSFLAAVRRSLAAYWLRDSQLQTTKKDKHLERSQLYCNSDRTVMTFTLLTKNDVKVEFVLQYKPLAVLPHKIDYVAVSQDMILDSQTEEMFSNLSQALYEHSICDVINANFAKSQATISTESSNTTPVFSRFAPQHGDASHA